MATITQPRSLALTVVGTLVVAVGVLVTLWWRQSIPLPAVTPDTALVVLGERPEFGLQLEAKRGNVTDVELRLMQGDKDIVAFQANFADDPTPSREVEVSFDLRKLGLSEGEAILVVRTSDDFVRPRAANKPALETPVQVDLTPPPLAVGSATRYPSAGGSGVAVLSSSDAVQLGVRIGQDWFNAFPAGPENLWVVYFALEVGHDPELMPTAVAVDAAGNTARRELPVLLYPATVPTGTVPLGYDWLRRKLPPLLPARSDFSDAAIPEAFREVSIGLRAEAAAEINELARKSSGERQWSGRFTQLRNGKVMSRFGVRRTYVLNGEALDEKVHQGYDLASVAHAEVPAANKGTVVWAGPLTIYGNAVVLDHGQGLLTLYGHCSSLGVTVGEKVERGQVIARTGATGLAGGDHLHFEVIVGGVPVNPLEWLDPGWIRTHIQSPLDEGGVPSS